MLMAAKPLKQNTITTWKRLCATKISQDVRPCQDVQRPKSLSLK
jgi:hypothetical protein